MTSGLDKLAGRRILFLNWRDLSNPAAGGAETYAEEIARRFVRSGATVTLFTSSYTGAAPYDWTSDYLVIRRGGRFGVYLAARRHLKRWRQHYDAVVDFQNGIPFFAPLWAARRTAVLCVLHHVHQQQFDMYFRWPMNLVARQLEGRVSKAVYRRRPLAAVSPSTRAEMYHQLGFREQIHIVPNGIGPMPPSSAQRSAAPAIAVVTRLAPHKRLHLLIEAVPQLLTRFPGLRLDIAGTGPAEDSLRRRISELALDGVITMHGRVSEQAKSDILSRAWLTAAPSLGEGWGLTIIEANAVGTPAVAFDVPGLRDSVRDAVTGWVVSPDRPLAEGLSEALEQLSDPGQQQLIAAQCRRWAARFSWDATAERMASLLQSEIARCELGGRSRRSPVHLATIAWWPASEAADLEPLLRKSLRVTDVITRDASGVRVMLVGCDELGAAQALRRIPVPLARLRLATTTEVLCGVAEDNPR